jgi:hypothetical protein
VLCAEFCQHLCHDRLQLRQVNRRYLPELRVVEALVFVPQDVAYPDDGGPRRFGVFGKVVRRQRFRSFRNDLDRPFDRTAMHVAALILRERKAPNDRGDAFDLIAK